MKHRLTEKKKAYFDSVHEKAMERKPQLESLIDEGRNLREISEIMDVSKSRVHQMIKFMNLEPLWRKKLDSRRSEKTCKSV